MRDATMSSATRFIALSVMIPFFIACGTSKGVSMTDSADTKAAKVTSEAVAMKKPLVTDIFTADPSAHVFEGKLYVYPSHDIDAGIVPNDNGDQYDMRDYRVISMEDLNSQAVIHDVALALEAVPWAGKQLWAPDAAYKNGKYYFFFPAKDKEGIFRIGVAVGSSPTGPFVPQPEAIPGSYSIDPAVFIDDDGAAYMYFGGLWGGQLEKWPGNVYKADGREPQGSEAALGPRVAKLSGDMLTFAEPVRELVISDENGEPLKGRDHARRFFEAAWMHKYRGKYYFSYSTGDTHYLVYAVGETPYGPFTYGGRILEPVVGWTTHHSIVEYKGKWYLFYHDAAHSGGKDYLRSVKVQELSYTDDGAIVTMTP